MRWISPEGESFRFRICTHFVQQKSNIKTPYGNSAESIQAIMRGLLEARDMRFYDFYLI